MLTEYSQETGFLQAAKDTFSGEKPCHLCCKITEAKKADPGNSKPQAPPHPEGKTLHDFIASPSGVEIARRHPLDLPQVSFRSPLFQADLMTTGPPLPPPRRAA